MNPKIKIKILASVMNSPFSSIIAQKLFEINRKGVYISLNTFYNFLS